MDANGEQSETERIPTTLSRRDQLRLILERLDELGRLMRIEIRAPFDLERQLFSGIRTALTALAKSLQ